MKWEQRQDVLGVWHTIFAWRPRYCADAKKTVWLESIWARRYWQPAYHKSGWRWHYSMEKPFSALNQSERVGLLTGEVAG